MAATELARLPVEAQATVVKPKFARAAQGDADHAILERKGRVIDRVVLDPEFANAEALGEAIRFDQRREADLKADRRIVRDRAAIRDSATWFAGATRSPCA